jgi:hypothetical protein
MGFLGPIPGRSKIFLFTTSRPTLRPNQPPIHCIPRDVSLEINWPEHDTDHPSPYSDEVKKTWSYTYTSSRIFMAK